MAGYYRDNERRVLCPYDKSHVLLHHRFQEHIIKCRLRHPEAKMVPCLYNATHMVYEPELAYHYETCEDRIGLDKFINAPENINPNRYPIPEIKVDVKENWDDENVPTYRPLEYCEANNIIFNSVMQTQSASVRREFKMKQRQKTAQLSAAKSNHIEERKCLRHPEVASGGIDHVADDVRKSEEAKATVGKLMAKVSLDANKVTAPKLSTTENNENEAIINNNNNTKPGESTGAIPRNGGSYRHSAISYNDEYPPLGDMQGNRTNGNRRFGTGGMSSIRSDTSHQVGGFTHPPNMMCRGRGRGAPSSK